MPITYVAKDRAIELTGRRDYLRYFDHGVTAATDGRVRAQVTSISAPGRQQSTGWHIHECRGQFLFTIEGWSELAFAEASSYRRGTGGAMFIPGGTVHNEFALSDDFVGLEMTVPALIHTVPTPPPGTVPGSSADPDMSVLVRMREDAVAKDLSGLQVVDYGFATASADLLSVQVLEAEHRVDDARVVSRRGVGTFLYGLDQAVTCHLPGSEALTLDPGDSLYLDDELVDVALGFSPGARLLEVAVGGAPLGGR